ncbi:hypothetical protein N9985_03360, partial [Gammaproteobacteria bacterium]|nr:hypothetical protein [Gammaproteobacteria bacterium]
MSKNAASADLIVSNYGFSIPVDAVITDVSYTILKKSPEGGSFAGSCTDSIVNMYVGARRSQYNFADTTTNWNVGLPAGEAIYSAPVASWGGLTPA